MTFQNWLNAQVHNYVDAPHQQKVPEDGPVLSEEITARHCHEFLPSCITSHNY